MSKGPGHVERGIEAQFLAHPDSTFTMTELARLIYSVEAVQPKHRVAIHRALRHVLDRNPDWSKAGGSTRRNHPVGPGGNERVIYNTRSWASVKEAGRCGYLGNGEAAARKRYFAKLGPGRAR
jgi:hypothetical protein